MALHRRLETLGYALLAVCVSWSILRRPRAPAPPEPARVETAPFEVAPALEPLFVRPGARRSIRWCEVDRVLEHKCRRCHGSPVRNGAPFPLLEYADTQRDYPPGSNQKIRERMLRSVRHRIMPPTALPLEPPVEALDAGEADVLLAWLEEGALLLGSERCGSTD